LRKFEVDLLPLSYTWMRSPSSGKTL